MSVISKLESKRSKSLDCIAYSVFKDFDQKNYILRATLHPKMNIKFERKHLEAGNFVKICYNVYIKSQKVLSVCMFSP